MRDLSFIDGTGHRFLEPGEYRVVVNGKTIKLNCVE